MDSRITRKENAEMMTTNEIITELKNSIARLETWEHLADEAQSAWDAEPLNPDREAAADNYYELQWHEWNHAAHLLQRLTKIDGKTARKMLNRGNRPKLNAILTA